MGKHYIIMSSSYTDGTRVALDMAESEQLQKDKIAQIISEIKAQCGNDVPLSTHFIETQGDSWASVVAYDPFFENVVCVQSVAEFSEKVKGGRALTGLDVATYILSKIKCTHLALEKLVYLAYAEYLCEYKEPLFEDTIYAFKHGPVVRSVYETYKRSGSQYVHPSEPDVDGAVQTGVTELPARSRILFARHGAEKLLSIDKTLQIYGKYSASTLERLTHRENSPWSYVDSTVSYPVLADKLIFDHHHVEQV